MFTGIIEATGAVKSIRVIGGDWRLAIHSQDLDFSDVQLGDSICVSGVCLTVVEQQDHTFVADVSKETIACTTMAQLKTGSVVNLEKALLPTSRLGGHIVSGHVDGIAELIGKSPDGRSERLLYSVSEELAKYIAHKGSVCLDGVSLTVNEVEGNNFSVNIIPHTSQLTTMQYYQLGTRVNLEVDIISRYLERLHFGDKSSAGLSVEKLINAGFGTNEN